MFDNFCNYDFNLIGFFSLIDCVGSLHQHTSDKNWRNRRSQKLDKMELLNLQSSLQSEIQAKAAISEELSRTRADLIAAQKYASFTQCLSHKIDCNNIMNSFLQRFTRIETKMGLSGQ